MLTVDRSLVYLQRKEPVGYQVGCGGSSLPRGMYFTTDMV